jgi:hypothetical protein
MMGPPRLLRSSPWRLMGLLKRPTLCPRALARRGVQWVTVHNPRFQLRRGTRTCAGARAGLGGVPPVTGYYVGPSHSRRPAAQAGAECNLPSRRRPAAGPGGVRLGAGPGPPGGHTAKRRGRHLQSPSWEKRDGQPRPGGPGHHPTEIALASPSVTEATSESQRREPEAGMGAQLD